MIIHKIKKDLFVLSIEPKEELISQLLMFCKKQKINSGFFIGFGAVRSGIIGRYTNKNYKWKKFSGEFEIGSLVGNLTIKDNELFIHSHIVLGDKNFKALVGHIKELVIYPTCEIIFWSFDKKIKRKYNKETNLFLIN